MTAHRYPTCHNDHTPGHACTRALLDLLQRTTPEAAAEFAEREALRRRDGFRVVA